MDKVKVKRDRSANFSLQERDILISLLQTHQHVIENKQSDATTWKKKESAWESIEAEFNARFGGTFRSSKTLRTKYEGLKRLVRKKSAAIRSELYRTGGGTNTAIPLDNVEEQIKNMITLTTDGLDSICDSDVIPQTQQSQVDLSTTVEEYTLLASTNTELDFIENASTPNKVSKRSEEDTENDALPSSIAEVTQAKHIILHEVNDNALDNTLSGNVCSTLPTSSFKKWDVTSRRNLKSRKHPALIATSHRKPIDELAQAKLELVQLQKELLEAEIIEKKKEWEFKEKERKWKEEEYNLKLEKLRRELNE